MYIAYLDDSDTKTKAKKWQVLTTVLVKDENFSSLEMAASMVVAELIPSENLHKFEEFHACELYGGYGVFEGIDQTKRFDAIRSLLTSLQLADVKIVYGAVNLEVLKHQDYSSANPVDIAFRSCIKGVRGWLQNESIQKMIHNDMTGWGQHFALLIADDGDKKDKSDLQKSFREIRKRAKADEMMEMNFELHDDMYFGDSKFSLGIQLADLCGYFIAKHLEGDVASAGFFDMIKNQIVYSKIQPETGIF